MCNCTDSAADCAAAVRENHRHPPLQVGRAARRWVAARFYALLAPLRTTAHVLLACSKNERNGLDALALACCSGALRCGLPTLVLTPRPPRPWRHLAAPDSIHVACRSRVQHPYRQSELRSLRYVAPAAACISTSGQTLSLKPTARDSMSCSVAVAGVGGRGRDDGFGTTVR